MNEIFARRRLCGDYNMQQRVFYHLLFVLEFQPPRVHLRPYKDECLKKRQTMQVLVFLLAFASEQ